MWEALSAGVGSGEQRHPEEQGKGHECVCLGKMRKGAQRGERDENVILSPRTNTEGGGDLWLGQEAWRVEIIPEEVFGLEKPKALSSEECE